MIVPKINPDEFGPGYLIRLGLVNGLKKQKEVTNRILLDFPTIKQHQNVVPYLLSSVLNQKIEDYCRQHTLLPIYRSITNIEENVPHGSLDYEYGIIRFGHFGLIERFKVCKSCIKEDIDYIGTSYYRRSHQIPGVTCCSKHGSTGEGDLFSAPIESFCTPDQFNDTQLAPLQQYNNPYINRIQSVLDGICHFTKPTNPNRLIELMQNQARYLGLSWSDKRNNKLFSDLFIHHLPIEWLNDSGLSVASKVVGKRSGSIDGVLSPQNKPSQALLYIYALSMLFDDSDQILSLIECAKALPDRKVKVLRKFQREYWVSDEFLEVYLNCSGHALNISKQLNVREAVISNGLKIAKLPALGQISSQAFQALKLFQNGHSLQEASNLTCVPVEKLEPLLRIAYRNVTRSIQPPGNDAECMDLEVLVET